MTNSDQLTHLAYLPVNQNYQPCDNVACYKNATPQPCPMSLVPQGVTGHRSLSCIGLCVCDCDRVPTLGTAEVLAFSDDGGGSSGSDDSCQLSRGGGT